MMIDRNASAVMDADNRLDTTKCPRCQTTFTIRMGGLGPFICNWCRQDLKVPALRELCGVTAQRLGQLMMSVEAEERIARLSGRVDGWPDDCRDLLSALRELRRRRYADSSQLELDMQLLGQLGEG